jgi:hypothetical protein
MSLNKTLDRLFDEIRREAKRNPEFADRLDAVLRLHESRRDVADEVIEDIATPPAKPAGNGAAPPVPAKPRRSRTGAVVPPPQQPSEGAPPVAIAPGVNPAGLYKREGEAALRAALESQDLGALRALVVEHNLDPSGVTPSLTRDELAEHILGQAKRRADRDDKMFDY